MFVFFKEVRPGGVHEFFALEECIVAGLEAVIPSAVFFEEAYGPGVKWDH